MNLLKISLAAIVVSFGLCAPAFAHRYAYPTYNSTCFNCPTQVVYQEPVYVQRVPMVEYVQPVYVQPTYVRQYRSYHRPYYRHSRRSFHRPAFNFSFGF